MTQKEYKNIFDEEDAVGWLEIDKVVEGIYGDQKPRHYAPPVHYMVGGEDPLDGVSIYDSQKDMFHRHLVSYGMSELYYNEEAAVNLVNGDLNLHSVSNLLTKMATILLGWSTS